ncbi:Invertebrate-type lysozyme 2 [Caenorhabditis elegans]|uniref:Invertebrate-type lysozyme 2 n=1 Tax=Caenorhabditis elegans TaxID=6239 RepID=ILYS2_CAEEL|nr:Invertebrate-type lysozyme 2 [Caenorhabditis elegans]O76358.1 RecName: Full=Invertebrate-type lysozyme 2; AltName: Full=1,4-beta-N-acetylmuramidase; Flags: Precursor [Caenorhabditis elegans]CCD65530.1 Invertebrate-type lysozyme 2 [Caenorhabditis elegans]|eukprot:NP_500207.1 Invertebrate-type lysozyme 2 [Caenorhabditis elegans]
MFVKAILLLSIAVAYASADCLHCICMRESGCKPIGCHMDVGSLSCGYYQIKIPYYEDCGQPGKKHGESTEVAWKRCADDLKCATNCVENYYNRYKHECAGTGQGACEVMARNHNGGPRGCHASGTLGYWKGVHSCCGCS